MQAQGGFKEKSDVHVKPFTLRNIVSYRDGCTQAAEPRKENVAGS